MKKTTTPALLMVGLALAAVLAGCGRSPAAPTTNHTVGRAALQGSLPGTTPAGYGAPAGPGLAGAPGAAGSAAAILAAVHTAQQAQQGFSGSIDTWEKGPDGSTSSQTLSVWWKRPNTLKLVITKGDSQSQDCKVLWDGSEQMKVKPSFMPFGLSLSITDSRLVSKNGWSIKETDISCILGVLLDPAAQVQVLGPQTVDGKAVTMLQVHSPKSPKGVTMEQIGIDTRMNLPVVRLMYKGNTIAYKLVAKTFKLSTPSSSDLSI